MCAQHIVKHRQALSSIVKHRRHSLFKQLFNARLVYRKLIQACHSMCARSEAIQQESGSEHHQATTGQQRCEIATSTAASTDNPNKAKPSQTKHSRAVRDSIPAKFMFDLHDSMKSFIPPVLRAERPPAPPRSARFRGGKAQSVKRKPQWVVSSGNGQTKTSYSMQEC